MANKLIQMSDGTNNLYPTMPYVYTDDLTVSGTHLNYNCIVRAATNSTGAPTTSGYLGLNLYIGSSFWVQILTNLAGQTFVRSTNHTTWERIDNIKGSTTCSVASGFTAGYNKVLAKENIVQLDLKVETSTNITKGSWVTLGTIPAGYRPPVSLDVAGIDNTNGIPVQIRINSTGVVAVWLPSSSANSKKINVHSIYYLDSE